MSVSDSSLSHLEPLPDIENLGATLDFLRKQRELSAINRRAGDEARKAGDTAQAFRAWQTASQQNLHALAGARQYSGFRQLFDQHGNPVKGRNYPLEGAEADFARIYCDTLGRQGGLYRRLRDLAKAGAHYRLGSLIEARSADLAFENSYNTLNAISIMIEQGLSSASPFATGGLPNLQAEILAARKLVNEQITEGKRNNDAWAKADLAMAIMLSNDAEATRNEVPLYYALYAAKADVDDIETTLRILKLVLEKLREMGDPVAALVEQGIAMLRQAAVSADKRVD
jgi:hypothetical protein